MVPLPDWLLTPERAAVHVPTHTAVIADLHIGYAQARQRRGDVVPACRLDDALAPLRILLGRHSFHQLIIAGDLFEEGWGEPVVDEVLDWLCSAGIRLCGVVPGNHDRGLERFHDRLPLYPEGMELDGWQVVHGDHSVGSRRVVQGHVHPCLRWGSRIKAPCFLVSEQRLILPAFSRDAAGVNVLRDPRWRRCHCHVIAADEVLDFGEVGALGRRGRAAHVHSRASGGRGVRSPEARLT